jgi:hypothetical protein
MGFQPISVFGFHGNKYPVTVTVTVVCSLLSLCVACVEHSLVSYFFLSFLIIYFELSIQTASWSSSIQLLNKLKD